MLSKLPTFYTIKSLAEKLELSETLVKNEIRDGHLPKYKLRTTSKNSPVRIAEPDVVEWIKKRWRFFEALDGLDSVFVDRETH